jgi:hypothetical protein
LQFLWETQTGAKQKTFGRLLWDDQALYIAYDAEDADITAQFMQRDDPTYRDDAVEIFINPDPKQETVYYGFEMNARGVLYDYLNYNSRTLFKRFDATGVRIATVLRGTLNVRTERTADGASRPRSHGRTSKNSRAGGPLQARCGKRTSTAGMASSPAGA